MIVVKDRKALVIKTKSPEKYTTVMPTAKHMRMKGTDLIAVPHRLDEVKVLRNLGVQAPSPIAYYYAYPGRNKPFMAQRETSSFLTMHRRAFVLNSLGTGKTLATLWAYDYLRERGKVNKLLVVSPLSTLERTWADEVFRNFTHLTYAVLHGDAKKRKKLLAIPHDVYIINHDGLGVIKDELAKRDDIDIVIVDEIAQCGRNASTTRWKTLNSVVNDKKISRIAWGLTGTPTPNAPTDAWAQCKLLAPDNVPPYFNKFKDMVMRQAGPFTWIARPNAVDTVQRVMQPAIRFTRDECIDLPPCMFETREVQLSDKQKVAYAEMLKSLKTEIAGGQVLAVNEAVKLSKLVQIACGVAYDTQGEEVCIGAEHRLEVMNEVIEASEAKVIIFVPFRSSVTLVVNNLEAQGHRVGVIHGGVSKNVRDETFRSFMTQDDMRVLVAQPAAMSHGLTLTSANTIIWFAPVTSNETFEQANGRITRPGQKNNQFIVMLEGTPVERRIYERLKNKQKLQGSLLDLVQEENVI
jgi:SNF2 family DNA or RNA helicase